MSDKAIYQRFGVKPEYPLPGTKMGIALGTISRRPINGLRHNPESGTNGWFVWGGEEMSDADDFFSPLHLEHISDYLPQVQDLLALPPGYRFLIDDNGYEDVWLDTDLLSK